MSETQIVTTAKAVVCLRQIADLQEVDIGLTICAISRR